MELTTARHVADELNQRRDEARMSYARVGRRVYDLLNDYAPTPETMRLYHIGAIQSPDLVVLRALCEVYDCTLEDVWPDDDPLPEYVADLLREQTSWSEINGIPA